MISTAVIQQPGKVEVRAMPDVPPPYIRLMRPAKPLYVTMKEYADISPTTSLEIETIKLRLHRVIGFSVPGAYWPDSWQDAWAIEELLKWEGRESEIRSDKYYADFVVNESGSSNPDRNDISPDKSIRSTQPVLVLESRASDNRWGLDSGADVSG